MTTTMEHLTSEYPTPTCLIISGGGGLASGASFEGVAGLIDLDALAWDLSDLVSGGHSHQHQTNAHSTNAAVFSAALTSGLDKRPEEERNEKEDEEAMLRLDGLIGDDGLTDELLDFELSSDVLQALAETTDLFGIDSLPPSTSLDGGVEMALTPSTDYMETCSPPPSMYVPTPAEEASSPAASVLTTSSGADDDDSMGGDVLRRTRGRPIDKRQSNKAAATKYRNKKQHEKELLFAECADYERKNAELKRRIDDAQTEISFIKSLLVEALIAKNVVRATSAP